MDDMYFNLITFMLLLKTIDYVKVLALTGNEWTLLS